jgi:hypothetical protein
MQTRGTSVSGMHVDSQTFLFHPPTVGTGMALFTLVFYCHKEHGRVPPFVTLTPTLTPTNLEFMESNFHRKFVRSVQHLFEQSSGADDKIEGSGSWPGCEIFVSQ